MSERKREQKSPWAKTPVANLLRYQSSGVYFARVRRAGKLIRRSLKTNVFSVAKIRLADLTQEQRKAAEAGKLSANGKMSFGESRQNERGRNHASITQETLAKKPTTIQSLVAEVRLARTSLIPNTIYPGKSPLDNGGASGKGILRHRIANPHLIGITQQLYANAKQHEIGCGRSFLRRPAKGARSIENWCDGCTCSGHRCATQRSSEPTLKLPIE